MARPRPRRLSRETRRKFREDAPAEETETPKKAPAKKATKKAT